MYATHRIARDAPFGNDFSSPVDDVRIKNSRFVQILDSSQQVDRGEHSPRKTDLFNTSSEELPVTPRRIRRSSRNSESTGESPWFFERQKSSPDFGSKMHSQTFSTPTGLNVASVKFGSMGALPHSQQEGVYFIKDALRKNANVSDKEEQELNQELAGILSVVGDKRLELIKKEIEQYDPYGNGVADASTVKRILLENLKHVSLQERTWRKILKMFARNPERPREIRYQAMVEYFRQIGATSPTTDQIQTALSPEPAVATQSSAMSSDSGDKKLVADIALCLKSVPIDSVDFSKLNSAFSAADRRNLGVLNRRDVESVFRVLKILQALSSVLERLLHRCDINSDQSYQWAMIVKFLEKAQPVRYSVAETTPGYTRGVSRPRRDMQSSLVFANVTNGYSHFTAPQQDQTPTISPQIVAKEKQITPLHAANYSNVSQNGVETATETRREKQLRLANLEEQIKKLTDEAETLRRDLNRPEFPAETTTVHWEMPASKSNAKTDHLLETLKKLDPKGTDWVPQVKAKQVIQQYNDLHQLGLNPRFIQSIIMLSSDQSDTSLSLTSLSQYLKKATQ